LAQADNKASTDWILLREARDLLVSLYQAPSVAQELLRKQLEGGKVRWRCHLKQGRRLAIDPDIGDPAFWNRYHRDQHDASVPRQVALHVNWNESWASRGGQLGYTFFVIEVARGDVLAMLPDGSSTTAPPPVVALDTLPWIERELQRLLADNLIQRSTGIGFVSELIAERMADAKGRGEVKTAMTARSIVNKMRNKGLWPPPPPPR
jgi:hypothetical protein